MILTYKGIQPNIDDSVFVAENATIIGNVHISKDASVWFGVVIRGDSDLISIGDGTNVQDLTTIHCDEGLPTKIGSYVTIGHGAIIHACHIGNNSLIGMGSIILDGATIGNNVIIGAGALVPPNKTIPDNVLVKGSPCQIVRELTQEEMDGLRKSAQHYVELANDYK